MLGSSLFGGTFTFTKPVLASMSKFSDPAENNFKYNLQTHEMIYNFKINHNNVHVYHTLPKRKTDYS
jgi:hypothetical protein